MATRLTLILTLTSLTAGCPATQPCPRTGPGSQPASSQPSSSQPASSQSAAEASATCAAAKAPTLELHGTPEVPRALRRRFGQYLNVRTAVLGDLAQDGRQLLVTTRFGSTTQVHRVRRPLGTRQQLTFQQEPVRHVSYVPGRTDQLVYLRDVGGNERYQIEHLDLKSGRTTLLTDGSSRHGDYLWSHDGRRLLYTSNARNGRDMDLYLGDGHSRSGRLFLEREGHWFLLDWSHDGELALVGRYVSINDSRLYTVNLRTKAVTRISPESPLASYRRGLFSRDGRSLYVSSDRGGEFVQLYRVDLASKRWQLLSRGVRWNVEGMALSADGRQLAFTTNEDGYSVLRLLDTRSGALQRVRGIPRGLIASLQFARRAPVLGFTLLGPTRPGDAYTLRLGQSKPVRWTESEVGGLNPQRFVEPQLLRYKTFDGRMIPAFYYRPPAGDGPFPVVVVIHGGPESQARPYLSAFVQFMVRERKVAVLVPNVRGSDGYGKSYLLLDNGFKREDSVRDIGALLDWVAGREELDGRHVGVFGGSYGGYMVLASLTHFPDRIAAGVDVVGISNFVTFLQNTKAYRRDLRRAEYGDERKPKMRAFLRKISPANNARRITSALFVAHGANDPRVPLSETLQMVQAVRQQGQDVWTMVAHNEGHGFRKRENRDMFYLLTVLFFDRHLGQGAPAQGGSR